MLGSCPEPPKPVPQRPRSRTAALHQAGRQAGRPCPHLAHRSAIVRPGSTHNRPFAHRAVSPRPRPVLYRHRGKRCAPPSPVTMRQMRPTGQPRGRGRPRSNALTPGLAETPEPSPGARSPSAEARAPVRIPAPSQPPPRDRLIQRSHSLCIQAGRNRRSCEPGYVTPRERRSSPRSRPGLTLPSARHEADRGVADVGQCVAAGRRPRRRREQGARWNL